ncbi:uncharacterized protein UDID_07592 [Ustilago sp. UG-2017a]|nr:uncharacterized protein UDID_07592 [Ustilago sp. UG-2017a]
MAFVHHQPRQQRRDRRDHPSAAPHHRHHRQEQEPPQDWSIVFPGRARQPPTSPTVQLTSPTTSPTTPTTDQTDDTGPLALTFPPLHDGTGRFLASPLSPASTDAALHLSGADDDQLSEQARHSEHLFPESVFSGTDSQIDADEELGFGSGSDFDFESDALASSHPSRSSAGRGAPRSASRPRPSKPSDVSIGSDDDHLVHPAQSHSSMLGSKAWSLLGRSYALERLLESPSRSTQLYSSVRSSRHLGQSRRMANDLPLAFTSRSERQDNRDAAPLDRSSLNADEADLAASNLAQSAGLSHLHHSHLPRRPKRRHRRSAAGRSSKRSNTSQNLLSIDYESRLLNPRAGAGATQGRLDTDAAQTPHSSATQASTTKTTRMIGTILRKVFHLEPEVLDAFLHDEQHHHQQQQQQQRQSPGFAFDSPETPIVSAPLGEGMMLDGRSENERYSAASATASDTEVEHLATLDPAASPLFSNAKPVSGEQVNSSSLLRLTEAALLQRTRPNAASPGIMEPTTMEALSAFMNTIVMPVPMPFRLLGALFGWSNLWHSSSSQKGTQQRQENGERAEREAEEERKYRYERLLSAQQAKAWSRRYRGILFANVDDEQPSPDLPQLWRGEEHPAIAGDHRYD